MANEFGMFSFNYYKNVKGFITEYANFSELANNISVNYSTLENTINKHNQAYENNIDEFNKTSFPYKFDLNQTIYSMIIAPSIHYTMGGVKINNKSEVIDTNNNIIYGLYGAGEVTGGVHGGNRLGGNSLSECGTFGRVSADSSVDYILNKYNNTDNSNNSGYYNTTNDDNDNDNDNINSITYNSPNTRKNSKGIGAGGIIAIVIGSIVAILAIAIVAGLCLRNINKGQIIEHNSINSASIKVIEK